jgi:hypothetical protein
MTTYAVTCYDCSTDDRFVIGPFDSAKAAYVWAKADADEKAKEWEMEDGLDAVENVAIVVMDGNHENVYEWSVTPLISPV